MIRSRLICNAPDRRVRSGAFSFSTRRASVSDNSAWQCVVGFTRRVSTAKPNSFISVSKIDRGTPTPPQFSNIGLPSAPPTVFKYCQTKYTISPLPRCIRTPSCYTVGMTETLSRFFFHWTFPAVLAVTVLLAAALLVSWAWDWLVDTDLKDELHDR